jgi:transcriptional regulator with XRE-family HTH domain
MWNLSRGYNNPKMEYTNTMGKEAVGAYLMTLRKARGLSQSEVVRLLADMDPEVTTTSESQISRIEHGSQDTRAVLALGYVRVVGGSTEHFEQLLFDQDATADDGIKLAKMWLYGELISKMDQNSVSADVKRVAQNLRKIGRIQEWLRYGEWLSENPPNTKQTDD